MRAQSGVWLALAASMVLLLPACSFVEEHRKVAIGAGAGAVAGGLAGGIARGSKGAAVGAVVGALAGGAIGAYLEHRDRTAEETVELYDYTPSQGVRLEVSQVAAEPATVRPGESVTLRVTYAVMAPNLDQVVTVRETRTILLSGVTVAQAPVDVARTSGTYTSEVPLALPAEAAAGTYEVQITVAADEVSNTLQTTFVVQ